METIGFNKSNPSPEETHPLYYIESDKRIETKKSGTMAIIAFGAEDRYGHIDPDCGGVAILHIDPDLYVAVKRIPWDPKARAIEAAEAQMWFERNKNSVSPTEIRKYFSEKCEYSLPAKVFDKHDKYIAERILKEKNKDDVPFFASSNKNNNSGGGKYTATGEKLIPLDEEEEE